MLYALAVNEFSSLAIVWGFFVSSHQVIAFQVVAQPLLKPTFKLGVLFPIGRFTRWWLVLLGL